MLVLLVVAIELYKIHTSARLKRTRTTEVSYLLFIRDIREERNAVNDVSMNQAQSDECQLLIFLIVVHHDGWCW